MSNKKTHVSVGIGTVSLLLVLATLSMSLLVVLSVLSARNDAKLTDRAIDIAGVDQGLYAASEELRAALTDAANTNAAPEETPEQLIERLLPLLPENAETEGEALSFTLSEGARMLSCTLRPVQKEGFWQFAYTKQKLFAAIEETEEEEWN